MSAHSWDTCDDPQSLLNALTKRPSANSRALYPFGFASDRKLRLTATSCLRHVWDLLDGRARKTVAALEDDADGHDQARSSDLTLAAQSQHEFFARGHDWPQNPVHTVNDRARWHAVDAVCVVANDVLTSWPKTNFLSPIVQACRLMKLGTESQRGEPQSLAWACPLIREVIGNPWSGPRVNCDKCFGSGKGVPYMVDDGRQQHASSPCRQCAGSGQLVGLPDRWLTDFVCHLAERVYGNREFDRLPELADALERIGCDETLLLKHLRQPTAQAVRGDWALDAILWHR